MVVQSFNFSCPAMSFQVHSDFSESDKGKMMTD